MQAPDAYFIKEVCKALIMIEFLISRLLCHI